MSLEAAVLSVLVSTSPHRFDQGESRGERLARLAPIAIQIAAVSRSREEAAEIVSIAINESRLARYVLEGRCEEGQVGERCDTRHHVPLARGAWQLHRSACPLAYEHAAGTAASLAEETRCVASRLGWAKATAPSHSLFSAMLVYCNSVRLAAARVRTYEAVLKQLKASK